MILTVDIGNSNIVLAIFDKDKIIKKWRIITSKTKSKDEYAIVIQQLMKADEIDFTKIKGIVLSSVVPEISAIFRDSLEFLNTKILTIGDKSVKLGLKIKKGLESEVGSDILMNIVAGKKKFKENFIIIDMGTATTFDIALKDAEYAGISLAVGDKLKVDNATGYLVKDNAVSTGMIWKVVKEYTMPDGQPGVKLQRIN